MATVRHRRRIYEGAEKFSWEVAWTDQVQRRRSKQFGEKRDAEQFAKDLVDQGLEQERVRGTYSRRFYRELWKTAQYTERRQDLLYGVPAIAEFLGLTERQARHHCDKGHIPTFRIGGTVCSRESAIMKWLDQHEWIALKDAFKLISAKRRSGKK